MGAAGTAPQQLTIHVEDRRPGFPVARLFMAGRAAATLFLWLAFFMNLVSLYFMTNWLPIIANEAGLVVGQAILVTAMFQVGGTLGGVAIGRLTDSFRSQWVLAGAFIGAASFVAAMGSAGKSFPILAALSFGAGFCVVGSQIGANALAGMF
jgi:AAHS family 4-hydroxybenzoate transporter-like MFS transporter